MHRTQIMLDDWQYERLRAAAQRGSRSLSSLIREAVTRYLEPQPHPVAGGVAEIAGLVEDPGACGRDHDTVIYGPRRTPS